MEGIYTFGLRVIFPIGADITKEAALVKECLAVHGVPVIDEDYFERGAVLKIPYSEPMVDFVMILMNGTLYNTEHCMLQFFGKVMPEKFLKAPIVDILSLKDLSSNKKDDPASA